MTAYHTITENLSFRVVKRIVSAPAPLPLIPTPNNAISSTVDNVSGSGARRIGDASYATITTISRERVVKWRKFAKETARRKSRNLGFWLSFWSLLGQRPKVTRARKRETPLGRIPQGHSFRCAPQRSSSAPTRNTQGGMISPRPVNQYLTPACRDTPPRREAFAAPPPHGDDPRDRSCRTTGRRRTARRPTALPCSSGRPPWWAAGTPP